VGGILEGIAITPDGATTLVTDKNDDHVIPIDTATNMAENPDPDGSRL
jgi:hypothetical protein